MCRGGVLGVGAVCGVAGGRCTPLGGGGEGMLKEGRWCLTEATWLSVCWGCVGVCSRGHVAPCVLVQEGTQVQQD